MHEGRISHIVNVVERVVHSVIQSRSDCHTRMMPAHAPGRLGVEPSGGVTVIRANHAGLIFRRVEETRRLHRRGAQ